MPDLFAPHWLVAGYNWCGEASGLPDGGRGAADVHEVLQVLVSNYGCVFYAQSTATLDAMCACRPPARP